MSVGERVLAGLAVAVCVVAGVVVARSPTGLEKDTKPEDQVAVFPQLPDEAEWLSESEEELVARLVHDPLKLRSLRSFPQDGRVDLKELVQRTEDVIRSTSRSAHASGYVDPDQRAAADRAVLEYARELERLAASR